MNPALWAAKTGLDAQNTRMTVTANNLANVATNGFKKGRATFEDLIYQNIRQPGGATSMSQSKAMVSSPYKGMMVARRTRARATCASMPMASC